MGVLLAIALIAYVVTKTVSDARIDHTYAKQGLVSPRLESRYGAAARERTARYGFVDYLGDAWSDHWQRRAAALAADREAHVANPGQRVRFRDRLARAKQVMSAAARKLVDPVPMKLPADDADVVPAELVPALAVDTGDVPVDTVRHTDTGREQWTGHTWKPLGDQQSYRRPRVGERHTDEMTGRVMEWDGDAWSPVCTRCGIAMAGYDGEGWLSCGQCGTRTVDDRPAQITTTRTATTDGGPTMTAPTGEAVNYETTVSELERLAAEQRGHVDACQAALSAIGEAKSSINDMQESYRASAAAASSMTEHLAAKNLDGVTLANAGTAADAMPAGVVDAMYDQLEAMEVQAQERLAAAEVALGATEANLAHIQATYGAAHETVVGNLDGDSSFLHSGGGVAGGGAGASGGTGGGYTREPVGVGVGGGSSAAGAGSGGSGAGPSGSGGQSGGGGIVETGDADINFTGVMGGSGDGSRPGKTGGGKSAGGPSNSGIQHLGTGEVNVSGSAFGDNATVNNS